MHNVIKKQHCHKNQKIVMHIMPWTQIKIACDRLSKLRSLLMVRSTSKVLVTHPQSRDCPFHSCVTLPLATCPAGHIYHPFMRAEVKSVTTCKQFSHAAPITFPHDVTSDEVGTKHFPMKSFLQVRVEENGSCRTVSLLQTVAIWTNFWTIYFQHASLTALCNLEAVACWFGHSL